MHNSVFVILLLFLIIIISTTTTTAIIIISVVTGLSYLLLLLNQRRSPPLRLQVSHCSTFCIMCDVHRTAVFCSESIECFPGMAFNTFLRPFVAIPVAPVSTGVIIQFLFHIRCISIHKLWYFSFFPLPFARNFFPQVLPHTSEWVFFFSSLVIIVISGPFSVTSLSVCTP